MVMKRQPWMSCRQAAIRLSVHHSTIARLIDRGKLRRVWLTPHTFGVTVASVQDYEIELERRNQDEQARPVVRSRREVCAGL